MHYFVGNICKKKNTAPGIPLHAETDPAKSHAPIKILWDRTTADALAMFPR